MVASQNFDVVYTRAMTVATVEVFDDLVLVAIDEQTNVLRFSCVLQAVARRIWELIDGRRQVAAIRDVIMQEFDAAPEVVTADLVAFLRQLEQNGVVRPV